jgi:hypothetical protein
MANATSPPIATTTSVFLMVNTEAHAPLEFMDKPHPMTLGHPRRS